MRFSPFKTGFTLVEIMIVLAIVVVSAALAIPGLLRARHNASEAMAIGSLKIISEAIETYRAGQSPPTYPPSLNDLSVAVPPYLNSVLGSGSKQGYVFTYSSGTATYHVFANPQTSGATGTRVFYVDESGVIRLDNASGSPI
ncbi:MAG: type II secretion system protein [Candidatus Omnitrophota bacterium]